jgi:hypothetical protein
VTFIADRCLPHARYIAKFNDETEIIHNCIDGNDEITQEEVRGDGKDVTAITEVLLGDCITKIAAHSFDGCINLTEIHLPDTLTSIGDYAFSDCYSLTEVALPADTSIFGSHCFTYCSGITSVTIPSTCESIPPGMFAHCGSFERLDIPDNIKILGDSAFEESADLGKIIPHELTAVTIGTGCTYVGSQAFYQCQNLASVTIYATTPPQLPENGQEWGNKYAFQGTKIQPPYQGGYIYVPRDSVEAYKAASGWSKYADRIRPIET